MLVADFEAEHVAGQIEGADLTAAIVEHLIRADAAADHFVEIFGRLVFAVDLGVACERHRRAHQLDRGRQADVTRRGTPDVRHELHERHELRVEVTVRG